MSPGMHHQKHISTIWTCWNIRDSKIWRQRIWPACWRCINGSGRCGRLWTV